VRPEWSACSVYFRQGRVKPRLRAATVERSLQARLPCLARPRRTTSRHCATGSAGHTTSASWCARRSCARPRAGNSDRAATPAPAWPPALLLASTASAAPAGASALPAALRFELARSCGECHSDGPPPFTDKPALERPSLGDVAESRRLSAAHADATVSLHRHLRAPRCNAKAEIDAIKGAASDDAWGGAREVRAVRARFHIRL
jgi:hypothetical protein